MRKRPKRKIKICVGIGAGPPSLGTRQERAVAMSRTIAIPAARLIFAGLLSAVVHGPGETLVLKIPKI